MGPDVDAAVRGYAEPYDISAFHRLHVQQGGNEVLHYLRSIPKELRFQFLPHYWGDPPKWRLRIRSLSKDRTLPDFACIGAIKSGTSDLSTYLFQHPSMIAPLSKEIFSDNPESWRPYYPTIPERQETIDRTGHASSGYFAPWMHHYPLADNFKAARPDAKVVLILRNPMDRAYSHYKWDILLGGKSQIDRPEYASYRACIDTALDLTPGIPYPSACRVPLLETGIYLQAVTKWVSTFGADNVHILRAEDFFADRINVACSVQEFLGLPVVAPVLHKIINQNPVDAPPEDADARARLSKFYEPWNDRLSDLLGRDMQWH